MTGNLIFRSGNRYFPYGPYKSPAHNYNFNEYDEWFSTLFTKQRDFHYQPDQPVTVEEQEFGPEEIVDEGKLFITI